VGRARLGWKPDGFVRTLCGPTPSAHEDTIPAERSRTTLPVLFGVVILDLVGFGIVMPILPFYAREFGADATTLGFLLMVYAAAQFICAPLWGWLSDRVGRRPVMLVTVAGTSLSLLALGLAGSLEALFVARTLGGVFAANVGVASAYIADVTGEDERTRWMGMLGASFGVGFVLGPAIGGLLAPWGYGVPMLVAAGLAAANFGQAIFALREPPSRSRAGEDGPPLGRMAVLRDPLIRWLCLANLLFSIAVTQLETVFAFFMMDRFSYDAREVAFVLVGMAVVMGGIQGGGMKALSARFAERQLVAGGALLLGGAFLAMPQSPSVAILLAPLGVAAVGRAVVQPSLMSLVSITAAARSRGVAMGTFQSAASLARVVGPVAAGWLYDREQAAPFWLASGLLLVVALLARALPKRAASAEPMVGEPAQL
jgi:DHA1 family tetracycline resistance protein-like MFS transporter